MKARAKSAATEIKQSTGPLASVASSLPTHGAISALRAIAGGAHAGLPGGLAHLALWLVIGLAGTFYATERRRFLKPRELGFTGHDLPRPSAGVRP
ncbi:hypothetical protein [Nonomuraea cavernae]|uniref:hypothetical protein n=1 Tax=Nonomuraea cavernae TaxID=2045107 RepID=UPI0033EAFAF9